MNTDNLKNILISKLFAINAIIIEKTSENDEVKENLKINSNILVKYPELFIYFLQYLELKYGSDLFDDKMINICGVNCFGSSFSHFLSYQFNRASLIYSSIKHNTENNNLLNQDLTEKQNTILTCDVLKSGYILKDVIDILEQNKYLTNKIIVLLDKHKEDTLPENILVYPIFKESEIYDYMNGNIQRNFFSNKLANNIYETALLKKSNLIFSCNLTNIDEICNCIHRLGSHIIAVKLNSENIYNFNKEPKERLKYLKKIYNLFLIDDKRLVNEYDYNFVSFKNRPGNLLEWADAITINSYGMDNLMSNWNLNNEDINVLLLNNESNNNIIAKYFEKNTVKHRQNKNVFGYIGEKNKIEDNLLNYDWLSISNEYENIDIYKKQNNLFWNLGNNILKIDDADLMLKNIETYKKLGWESFKKY